jgi:hypothetical protein
MDLNEALLGFALTYLGLAVLVRLATAPVTGDRVGFPEACVATLAMAVCGGIGAVALGALYKVVRPAGLWLLTGHVPLVGWQVSVDEGIVWALGAALGYLLALQFTVEGRVSRRIVLAVLLGAATPALLFASEWLVTDGIAAAREMLSGVSPL